MECSKCKAQTLYLQRRGTATGLYCMVAHCNKWQKWVGAKDLKTLQAQGVPFFREDETPRLIEAIGYSNQPHYDPLPDSFNYNPQGVEMGRTQVSQSNHVSNENPVYESYDVGIDNHQHLANTVNQFYNDLPVTNQKSALCITCTSGIVPSLTSDDDYVLRLNRHERLITISENTTGHFLTAFKTNYCPTCGVSLIPEHVK